MKKQNNSVINKMIEDLQSNLKAIREAGGWSAAEFADMVQLSRQTIWNLEHNVTTMLPVQYVAIRHILDYEIQNNPDESIRTRLNAIVNLALEHDEIPEPDRKRAIAYVRGTKDEKLSKNELEIGLKSLLVGVSVGAIITGVAVWITKIIKH